MRLLIYLFCFIYLPIAAQVKSEYGVYLIEEEEFFKKQVEANPSHQIVDLMENKSLFFDIRYATENNFTNAVIYPKEGAFARLKVAKALFQANQEFNNMGLAIKVFDAYRPYDATVKFYEIYKDTTYVASPYSGSRHNRACAIDLTLVDMQSGEEVQMPTTYDDFTEKAHPDYMELDEVILANRKLLIDVMKKYGFEVYPSEWWHFDFQGWEEYPILNLSFETLNNVK